MTGVREYFARYPYTCLEQRASKAIGLGDDALWNAVAASLPNYLDRDGLARYFPADWLAGQRCADRLPRAGRARRRARMAEGSARAHALGP